MTTWQTWHKKPSRRLSLLFQGKGERQKGGKKSRKSVDEMSKHRDCLLVPRTSKKRNLTVQRVPLRLDDGGHFHAAAASNSSTQFPPLWMKTIGWEKHAPKGNPMCAATKFSYMLPTNLEDPSELGCMLLHICTAPRIHKADIVCD